MSMKKITLIALLCLGTSMTYAQAQKNLAGFQDIPWGSPIQTVKAKFPLLKPYDSCKGAKENEKAMKEFLSSRNTSCTNYSLEKYDVDGISFNLIFSFTLDGGLRDVVLDRYREGIPSVSTPECQSAYAKLGDLLKVKYGAGTAVPSDMDYMGFKELGFQGHEAQLWVLGSTQINLSNNWNHKKNPNLCWVNLNYTTSKQANASKL
jgi:hypothetical protein